MSFLSFWFLVVLASLQSFHRFDKMLNYSDPSLFVRVCCRISQLRECDRTEEGKVEHRLFDAVFDPEEEKGSDDTNDVSVSSSASALSVSSSSLSASMK